ARILQRRADRAGVDLEKVALDDGHVRTGRLPQKGNEIAVDLERENACRRLAEEVSERPPPGPDFKNHIRRLRTDGVRNLRRLAAREKVLAKPLTSDDASSFPQSPRFPLRSFQSNGRSRE